MKQAKLPRQVLGFKIDGRSYATTAEQCVAWAKDGETRTVLFANVHMIMEAHDDRALQERLTGADLVNPDGMPLVWALRMFGFHDAARVYGPDATLVTLSAAETAGIPVGFYGGSFDTLTILLEEVQRKYPKLRIVYSCSPPFRTLTADEDEEIIKNIADSGLRMLFVGLGCPKQELWIMDRRGRISAVMLAVGAAFDFIAGTKPQAPRWMMQFGLEWAFRLASEPRRLFHRYFKHNPRFLFLILIQGMRGFWYSWK